MEEEKRAAREKAERERMREERARQAEERSKEAARRAREQQEQVAKERLRREREREAEKRSEEAARKVRIEQERAAQERLKSILIEEQQDAIRRNWTKIREAAEHREGEPAPSSLSSTCAHPRFGWPRKKGRVNCVFCTESCPKWSFRLSCCNSQKCREIRETLLERALKHSERAFKGSAHWPDLLARIIVLICSAMRNSMPVIRHMSASLANSIAVVIAMSGAHSLNTTRPRHTHCTSISKLRGVTTPFISSNVVACSSPSLKVPANVAAKYGDCL